MSVLFVGDHVWMPDRNTEAVVGEEAAPRSYVVITPTGVTRRNRKDVIHMDNTESVSRRNSDESTTTTSASDLSVENNRHPDTDRTTRTSSTPANEPVLRRSTRERKQYVPYEPTWN